MVLPEIFKGVVARLAKKEIVKTLLVFLFLCSANLVDARPRHLTLGPGKEPALASDRQGGLHLIYESAAADNDIYYRNSQDGADWQPEINLSRSAGISSEPALTIESGGAVDAVWADTSSGSERPDIYFSRSADGGKTWSDPLDVSHTPRLSRSPSIAAGADGSLHLCWVDTSRGHKSPDLYYAFSYNHGQSWSRPAPISGSSGVSGSPTICTSANGLVHIAWTDGSTRPALRIIYGQDQGWSRARVVSTGICSQPVLASGPKGKVDLCWIDQLQRHEIPNVYLQQVGTGRRRNLSKTSGTSRDAALTVGSHGPQVAWIDTTAGERSPDVWISLRGRVFNLSHTPGISRAPVLAEAQGQLWTVWEELDLGNCSLKLTTLPLKGR